MRDACVFCGRIYTPWSARCDHTVAYGARKTTMTTPHAVYTLGFGGLLHMAAHAVVIAESLEDAKARLIAHPQFQGFAPGSIHLVSIGPLESGVIYFDDGDY